MLSVQQAFVWIDLFTAAYRGHQVRKRVADDKTKAKLDAFITQFQAGKNNKIQSFECTDQKILCISYPITIALSLSGPSC